MRLGFFFIRLRCPDLDDVVAAYRVWRHESAAVHSAYGAWLRAPAREAHNTFSTYVVALDREERAAQTYARVASSRATSGGARPRASRPAAGG